MKSFSCVLMRKRKSKTAVLKSADRNEEYSRKKNLWTKNWKTSNAKRTIFPANKKAWKNGLQKPKPSRIARWMFWNESQNSLGNRQRNTSCNIWKTNWCMKRQWKSPSMSSSSRMTVRRKQEITFPSPLQSVHPIRFRNRQFRLCRCLTMKWKVVSSAERAETSGHWKPSPAWTWLSTTHRKPLRFPVSIRFGVKLPVSLWKNSLRTAESIRPRLKKWWKRQNEKWNSGFV